VGTNSSSNPNWGGVVQGIMQGMQNSDGSGGGRGSNNRPNPGYQRNYYNDGYNSDYNSGYNNYGSGSGRNYYQSGNGYSDSYPEYAPPAPAEPQKNSLPKAVPLKPKANEISLRSRQITAAELQACIEQIDGQLDECVTGMCSELEDSFVKPSDLIAEMSKHNIEPAQQTQLLQAIRTGNAAQAQILWTQITGDAASGQELYGEVELQHAFSSLSEKALSGTLSSGDLRMARTRLSKMNLPAEARRGVTKTFKQLEDLTKIRTALDSAVAGSASSTATVPAGVASVIYNPGLPSQSILSLGNGYLMVGLGGTGSFSLASCNVVQSLGWPSCEAPPLAESQASEYSDGVLVMNPVENEATVHYTVSGHSYSMAPGHKQHLPAGTNWRVEFDRGGKWGKKAYTLTTGGYYFAPSEQGWELYSKTFECALDNTGNPNPFHCVVQNKYVTLAPGEVRSWTCTYPLLVRYDRGNGSASRQLEFVNAGTYRVAINTTDNLWELYPSDQVQHAGLASGAR
jgi:hypothetical protein